MDLMKSYHMVNFFKNGDSVPRAFIAPGKYIQGKGIVKYIGKYVCSITPTMEKRTVLVLISPRGLDRFGEIVGNSLKEEGIEFSFFTLNGECSYKEIDRVKAAAEEAGVDLFITMGGGKAVDLGKAVSCMMNKDVIIVPTLASNDAPTASLSVIYDDDTHERQGALFNYKNPCMVVMDTEIIANAPARYLVAGIGDALATMIEARSVALNPLGESSVRVRPTLASEAICEKCTKVILEHGLLAVKAVEEKRVDEHLEAIVEANTLLSGLGFENGGVSGAHAMGTGITALPGMEKRFLHGEMVAVGTLTQLAMEGRDEELQEMAKFYTALGLPVSWTQLGIDVEGADVDTLLGSCFVKFYAIKNMTQPKEVAVYRDGMRKMNAVGLKVIETDGEAMWVKMHPK